MRDALQRIGGIASPPLEPILAAESPFHYRNKLEYSFTQTPSGPALGFHKAGRWDEVLEIETLLAHHRPRQRDPERGPRLGARGEARRVRPGRADRLPAPPRRPRGAQHRPGARPARHRAGREVRARLLRRGAAPLPGGALDPLGRQRHAVRGDEPAHDPALGRGRDRGGAARAPLPRSVRTPSSRRTRRWRSGSTRSRSSTPPSPAPRRSTTSTAAPARSGSRWRGTRSRVWGVEISEESVACALENLDLNGIGNAAFFAGNVGQSLEELAERAGPPDVVVVDPPRAGLAGKALRRTGALGAGRLVYVSCNPTTLASDVKVLRGRVRLRARRARPVDMFPHTPHVETVALLTRRSGNPGRSRAR